MRFINYFFIFFALTLEALPTKEISIGNQKIIVEIAESAEDLNKGLMGRKELKNGHGMLFIFQKPGPQLFWMKNTYIPLSIAFFDQERVLINKTDMPPCTVDPSLPCFKSLKPALYALEVPQGWFEKHGIEPGMKFSFPHP